ncbi:hypothetical protein V5O48_017749 [Marasmius crinis-equi]|uniref:Uncharacterized protein n=1 Tax=Marasmius crinis-equi TaxID=585013 RepID=A0ABR3EN83_9AGAR
MFQFDANTVSDFRPFIRPIRSSTGLRVADINMKTRVLDRHRDEANLLLTVRLPPDEDNTMNFVFGSIDNHLRQNDIVPSAGFGKPYDGIWGQVPRASKNSEDIPSRKYLCHMPARAPAHWKRSTLMQHARLVQSKLGTEEPSIIVAPREGHLIVQGHHCIGPKLLQGYITHFDRVRHDDDPIHAASASEEAELAIGCYAKCSTTRLKAIHRNYPPHLPLDTTWTEVDVQAFDRATVEDDDDDIAILTFSVGSTSGSSSMPTPSTSTSAPSTGSLSAPSAGSVAGPAPSIGALSHTLLFLNDAIDSDDEDQWASVLRESRLMNEEHEHRLANGDTVGVGSSESSSDAGPSSSMSTAGPSSSSSRRRARSPEVEITRAVRQRLATDSSSSSLAIPSASPAAATIPSLSPSVPFQPAFPLPQQPPPSFGPAPRNKGELLRYIARHAPKTLSIFDPGPDVVRVECIRLTGTTTEDLNIIGQMYYEEVIRYSGGVQQVTIVPDFCTTIPRSSNAFLAPPSVQLHHGVRTSVSPAFMTSVVHAVLNDRTVWQHLTDDLKVLSTNEVLDSTYQSRLRAAGHLTLQYLVTHKALPRSVSPAFFEALIHGEEAVDDEDWIEHFHPSAARTLRSWGKSHDAPIEDDQAGLNDYTAKDVLGKTASPWISLSIVNAMSTAQRKGVRRQLVAHFVLGITIGVHTFDDHPTIFAFKHGFDIRLPGSMISQTVCTAFGPNSKPIILALSNMFPRSGEELEVKEVISWHSSEEDSLLPYEAKWKAYFWRYIRGTGHVDHPQLNDLIAADERERLRGDRSLRARFFLQATTASEVIPEPEAIKVNFVHRSATEEDGPSIYSNVLLAVRSCFKDAKAFIGPSLRQLLDELPDDEGQVEGATAFDVALHLALAGPGANSFQMS